MPSRDQLDTVKLIALSIIYFFWISRYICVWTALKCLHVKQTTHAFWTACVVLSRYIRVWTALKWRTVWTIKPISCLERWLRWSQSQHACLLDSCLAAGKIPLWGKSIYNFFLMFTKCASQWKRLDHPKNLILYQPHNKLWIIYAKHQCKIFLFIRIMWCGLSNQDTCTHYPISAN
jgi:hypothetical protein